MATYYVSNSGSDSNAGTSSGAPFATLSTAASAASGGDTIYLERGSEWREWMDIPNGSSASALTTIDAYGSGDLPIINGCDILTGWTLYSGSIYYATLTSEPDMVFVDGTRIYQARYPKSSLLTADSRTSTTLTDSALTQADDYWNGATMCIRTSDWTWEQKTVSDYVQFTNVVTVSSSFTYTKSGAGYFFRGLLSELTQAGEWVYVESENRLYLWMPDSSNPSGATIQTSQRDWGIGDWNQKFASINNIKFFGQQSAAIMGGGSLASTITISDCEFDSQAARAIRLQSSGHTVSDNTITNTLGRGIELYQGSGTISGNTISNIGLWPGYGNNGENGMIGIWVEGSSNTTITKNVITDVGYNGITCNTSSGSVTKNIVTRALKELTDGGAIYCWGSSVSNTTISNNFIYDVKANIVGIGSTSNASWGIYLDNNVNNCTVSNNTINGSEHGGILNNADGNNNDYTSNLLLDCESVGLEFADWVTNGGTINNTATYNVIYCRDAGAECVRLRTNWSGNEDDMCDFGLNYYGDSNQSDIVFKGIFGSSTTGETLAEWKVSEPSENSGSLYANNASVTLFENKTDVGTTIYPGAGLSLFDGSVGGAIYLFGWTSILLLGTGVDAGGSLPSFVKIGGKFIKSGDKIIIQ